MSTRLFLILIPILALVEGTLLPSVFLEGVVVVWFILFKGSQKVAAPLLLGGFILDFLQNQTLGVSSLLFLTTGALFLFFKDKLPIQHPIALVLVVAALDLARVRFVFGSLFFPPTIIAVILAFLVFSLVWRPQTNGGISIRMGI